MNNFFNQVTNINTKFDSLNLSRHDLRIKSRCFHLKLKAQIIHY